MEAGLRSLIASVRSHAVSADIPIVIFGFTTSKYKALAEQIAAEDPNIYCAFDVDDTSGMGSHASKAAQEGYAAKILEVLQPLV